MPNESWHVKRAKLQAAAGLCSKCTNKAEPGKKRCEVCLEKCRESSRKRSKNPEVMKKRKERRRATHAAMKAAGLCIVVKCGRYALPNNRHCQQCYDNSSPRRRLTMGICPNCPGQLEPGKSLCRGCLNKARDMQRKKLESGTCTKCREPVEPGKSRCRTCLDKARDYALALQRKRLANGLCGNCNNPRVSQSLCGDCLEKMRVYAQKRHKAKYPAAKTAGLCVLHCGRQARPDRVYCRKCADRISANKKDTPTPPAT